MIEDLSTDGRLTNDWMASIASRFFFSYLVDSVVIELSPGIVPNALVDLGGRVFRGNCFETTADAQSSLMSTQEPSLHSA